MVKKILAAGGLFALGAWLWMGTGMGSYVRTGVTEVAGMVHGQVPVEFEIKRAKQLLSEMDPTIKQTMRSIFEQEARIERTKEEIATAEENLKREQVALLALKNQLGKGLASYKVGSSSYSADEMRAEVNRRFNSFKQADATLQAREKTVKSQELALKAAHDKYAALLEAKLRLEGEVAELEARHKMIEAQKTANHFEVDDSELARIRGILDDLDERLTVDQRMAESEGELIKRIPVEEIPPADLETQIDEYFGAPSKTDVKATAL